MNPDISEEKPLAIMAGMHVVATGMAITIISVLVPMALIFQSPWGSP